MTLPMLEGSLAFTGGAIGGVWRQRAAIGAIPGATLAATWYFAIGRSPDLWNVTARPWSVLSFVALGFLTARLVGPPRIRWIHSIPLDGRLVFALFTGFLLRGALIVFMNCLEIKRT